MGHIWTLFCVVFSFYIFVFDGSLPTLTGTAAISYLGVMFGAGGTRLCDARFGYEFLRNLPFLTMCVIGMTPLVKKSFWRLYEKGHARLGAWLSVALTLIGLVLSTAYLVDSAYNPFLYFRF